MTDQITRANDSPLILIVPGLGNSGAGHWQTLCQEIYPDCRRVELGQWDRPHRNSWVNQLNLAVRAAQQPVVLVAHSLGCLAVAWWNQLERPGSNTPVRGALLVAPPDVDFFPVDDRLAAFAPTPQAPLPFPSIVAASRNDPYIGIRAARRLARAWGSNFADAGEIGHINAASNIGDWQFGRFLLQRLLSSRSDRPDAASAPDGANAEAPRLSDGRGAAALQAPQQTQR